MVKEMHAGGIAVVAEIVSDDDDSTMRAKVRHSYKARIAAGRMSKAEWPKTKKGKDVKDNRELPLNIPEPTFLADPTHRIKVIGKHLFALRNQGVNVTKCKKSDYLRLKRYWGFMFDAESRREL